MLLISPSSAALPDTLSAEADRPVSDSEPLLPARLPTGFQPIHGWPPPTLPDRTLWRLSARSTRPVMLELLVSWGGEGGPGRIRRPPDDIGPHQ